MKCAPYIRVSTDIQRDNGDSLDVQTKRLKAYAEAKNWSIVSSYVDTVSAKDTDRPQFKKMMEDVENGNIDAVLCTKLDRLFRSTKDFLNTCDYFEKKNVQFVCLDGDIDTSTPVGRVFSTMRAAFAQFERETIADRVRDVMRSRAEDGRWNGGVVPLGYKRNAKKLEILPEEANLVKEIYKLYLKIGSIRGVTNHLNLKGVRTRVKGLWSTTSIKRTLMNPFYIGKMVYSKRSTDYSGRLKKSKKPILSVGEHPPIIDIKIFNEVQERMGRGIRYSRIKKSEFLLSGLVFCDKCGSRMYGHNYTAKHQSYYRCHGYTSRGNCQCEGNSINTKIIETSIEEELKGFTLNPESFRKAAKSIALKKPVKSENTETENQLNEIKRQKERLLDIYQDGGINKQSYVERSKILDQQKELLEEDLLKSKEEKEDDLLNESDLDSVLNACHDLSDIYSELDIQDRKELLRNLIDEVRINKDHFDFSINIPSKVVEHTGPSVYQKERTGIHALHKVNKHGSLIIKFRVKFQRSTPEQRIEKARKAGKALWAKRKAKVNHETT